MPKPARELSQPQSGRNGSFHILGLVAVFCLFYAWAGSLAGVFLLDDLVHIVGNPEIRRIDSFSYLALHRARPLVDLSLAVNYAIGGSSVTGYHVFNLTVHLLAALALYGLARRVIEIRGGTAHASNNAVMRSPDGGRSAGRRLRERSEGHSNAGTTLVCLPALAVAAVWSVHPLTTQAVTYVIQRGESMMALFYLLTLYCVVRIAAGFWRIGWCFAAIVVCAAGMLCKTVMITAPVVALLMDRAWLAPSWRDVFVRRWWLHLGLAATWLIPLAQGVLTGLTDPAAYGAGTVGFNVASVTPWQYLISQGGVILHYLRLCVWPDPLIFDYAWPAAESLAETWPACLVVLAFLVASITLYARRPSIGFIPVAFFVILAPTSSFVPIADLAVEHRMYLPLTCVVALVVLCIYRLLRGMPAANKLTPPTTDRVFVVLMAVLLAALSVRTHLRNRDYQSELAIWSSVVDARPRNARARSYLGDALMDSGRADEGIAQYREALQIDPDLGVVENNLATALAQTGRLDEAITVYQRALERDPKLTHVHLNLALALHKQNRLAEAVEHYRAGLATESRHPGSWHNLGAALRGLGQYAEAEAAHRTALALQPMDPDGRFALAGVLELMGRREEAIEEYREVLRLLPTHAAAKSRLQAFRAN